MERFVRMVGVEEGEDEEPMPEVLNELVSI